TIGVGVADFFDRHDATIGRRQYVQLAFGRNTRRIAEKLQYKYRQQPEWDGCQTGPEADEYGNQHYTGQERPAFACDKRMRIRRFIHDKTKNNRNKPTESSYPAWAGQAHPTKKTGRSRFFTEQGCSVPASI